MPTVLELKAQCKKRGIKGYSNLKKKQLLQKLSSDEKKELPNIPEKKVEKVKIKRCPRGTRSDKKTGECKKKDNQKQDKQKPMPKKYGKVRYIVQKKLGSGASGQVFLAKDSHKNQYAIKEGKVYSMKKQSQLLHLLKYKNICEHFLCPVDYYEKNGKGHIVMQYLKNYIDLKEAIKEKYCISPKNFIKLKEKLKESLQLLHDNDLIHSDIKPANIMVEINIGSNLLNEILPNVRIIDVGGMIKKSSDGKNMKINTYTPKYFDFSVLFPNVSPSIISDIHKFPSQYSHLRKYIFDKTYTFEDLAALDKSALRMTLEELESLEGNCD